MNSTRIVYAPRPDAAPETEFSALASVYRLVLESYAKKKGSPATAPDARKESNGSGKQSIP
jgi:hypothetical protein